MRCTRRAFFVTRAKRNLSFKRRYSQPVDRIDTNVLCDQIGTLTVFYSSKATPRAAPRVVRDDDGKTPRVSDQQLSLAAASIAELVPAALAGRVVLQVDQAAPAHQGLLRHHRERRQDPNLDRGGTYVLIAIVKKRLSCLIVSMKSYKS